MINTFYVIECTARGCNAEFYINGIPLILRGPGNGDFFAAPINQYLIKGKNVFEILVKPGDTPSTARNINNSSIPAPKLEQVSMKLKVYPGKSLVNSSDGKELLSIRWPEKDILGKCIKLDDKYYLSPLKKDKQENHILDSNDKDNDNSENIELILSESKISNSFYKETMESYVGSVLSANSYYDFEESTYKCLPIINYGNIKDLKPSTLPKKLQRNDIVKTDFPLSISSGINSKDLYRDTKDKALNNIKIKNWQQASRLKLKPKTITKLGKFLETLHLTLTKFDTDNFVNLSLPRIEDNADAYNKTVQENIDLIKESFEYNKSSESGAMAELKPANYDFRLCANRKMVQCIAKDWKPALREVSDETDNSTAYYDIFLSKIKSKWKVVL